MRAASLKSPSLLARLGLRDHRVEPQSHRNQSVSVSTGTGHPDSSTWGSRSVSGFGLCLFWNAVCTDPFQILGDNCLLLTSSSQSLLPPHC